MTNWKFILYRARWELATVDPGGKPSEKRSCFTFSGKIQRGKQENLTKMMA